MSPVVSQDISPSTAPAAWAPARVPGQRAWIELRRWGWPAAVGGALLVCAALLQLGTLQLQQQTQTAHEDTQRLRLRALARPAAAAPAATAGTAVAFRQAFAPAASRVPRVAALLAAAQKRGLVLQSTELRLSHDTALGLSRYRIVMPAQGSYAGVRAFVAESLRGDPGLALDGLRLQRDDNAAGGLHAELRWSIYTRLDGGAP